MNRNFMDSLCKPELYTKTKGEFWNDEYISKQMLEAHLDPNFEAASRKLAFIEKSAEWIKELVPPTSNPILLDLGCGPGIYDERFVTYGYQVTGVDFSQRSIRYAKESADKRGLDITYWYLNYLEMDLNKQFDFITMIYCDYGALSTDDRLLLLKKAYQHLKPGGKFLFDVFTMKGYDASKEEQTWNYNKDGGFWRAGEHVEMNGCYKYSDCVTLSFTLVITEEEIMPYYIWDTYFTQESLTKEVEANGFKVLNIFGDVAGSEYNEDSKTMAILLERV